MTKNTNFSKSVTFSLKPVVIVVCLIMLCCAGLYILFTINKDNLKESLIPPEVLKNSKAITTFKLDNKNYLSFPLATLAREVRIATNVEFSPDIDLRQSSNKESYAIEAQAYDISGRLVETRIINYATKAEFYFSEELGMYLASYYLDSENLPGETRVGRLNFKDTGDIAEIRLKRVDNNFNLLNVYARVYQQAGIGESRRNFYWFNIMRKDRERLSYANLYPVDMMLKEERLNLIKNLWIMATPGGIPNRDFTSKKLYSLNNPTGIPYDINLLHSGNYVDEIHSLVIPINEDNSNINIEIISADIIYPKYMKIWLMQPQDNIANILKIMRPNSSANSENREVPLKEFQFTKGQIVDLTWRGRGIGQTIKYQIDVNDRRFSKDYNFNAGSIVINSNSPAYVNINSKSDNKLTPIISNPTSSNLISLQQTSYVEYGISHAKNEPSTPFRVDLRKISTKMLDVKSLATASYELVDIEGKVIKQGEIQFPTLPTNLDFTVTQQGLYLSDRVKYYFDLSPEVAKIRFKGESDIFIAGFNRLDSFVRSYIIPDDYKISQNKKESLRRTWFFRTPLNYDQIRGELRTIIVKSQNRVIDENQFVGEGIYDWQEILPEGTNWKAVEVAERKLSQTPSRVEAEGVEFSPVAVNQKQELEFVGHLGENIVAPTLMYNGKVGATITIYVDNKEVVKAELTNPNGEINLPNIPVGKHSILINATESMQGFLNYLKIDQDSLIKHNIISFKQARQTFWLEKTTGEEQIVTLKAYSLTNDAKTLVVDIDAPQVLTNTPNHSYTIKKRKFEMRFTRMPENIRFIDNEQVSLYGAEPVFIKLGSDLAKGRYKMILFIENYDGFYVSLSTLKPGLVDKRTISTEVEDEN